MADATNLLDYGALLSGIGGGLALFLYGMRKMTESLKVAAGGNRQTQGSCQGRPGACHFQSRWGAAFRRLYSTVR